MQHLIEKHRYPSDYPFDIVATGTLSFEERQAHMKRQRAKELRKHKGKAASSSSHKDNPKQRYQSKGLKNHDDDMDVDQLTNSMSALSIPETISFGRGRPAFARRPPQQQHHQQQRPRRSERKVRKKSHCFNDS